MKKRPYKLLIKVASYSCIGILSQILWVGLSLAHDADAQNAKSVYKVNIEAVYNNTPLADVFTDIESKTDFVFTFDNKDAFLKNRYSKHGGKTTVADILKEISLAEKLIFQQINNNISIRKKQAEEKRETPAVIVTAAVNVSGTVTSEADGEGLPGVNVLVKNTSIGTVTDMDGKYTITAPNETDILVFSSIGFVTQEIAINGATDISISLSEELKSLGEVVVTALGISREKAALPYAVSEVKGEDLTEARENNLGKALTGRIAGVNATTTATGPSGSSRVIIRGNGSLNGDNQPLFVVNGMPIDNTNQGSAGTYGGIDRGDGLLSINPDDIENISVLKGGTAAALYGSRAANGVILITTKSGKAQQGIGIEFNSNFTVEAPLSIPDWQYQYGSGSRGTAPISQSEAIANGRISWGAPLDGSMVVQPDGESRPYIAQKDNIENFYNNGKTFSNTLALNGGNEIANFRFSVSNMDNSGIVPNNTVNRKTFNLSANANLADRVIFEGKAQYNIEETENRPYTADFTLNPNAGAQLIATNIDVRTLAPGYNEVGFETPWSDYIYATNPYFAINKASNGDTRHRFIGSFSAQYNITEFFYARARMGMDYFNLEGFNITPTGTAFNNRGSMTTNERVSSETNVEGILGFKKEFGAFSVNALVGGNQMHNLRKGVNLNSGFFNVPFQYFIGNGSSQTFSQEYRETAINSIFASADIGFNNYLYLSLTGRQDWFSTLPKESNSLFYPSVGLSFVFSDAWESRPAWMDHGKIRASWAQVGGGAPDPYGLSLRYSAQAVPHLGQPLMEISGETIPNSLKPYTSTTYELGIELKAFNNRLGADITLYNRTTTDDIVNASIPISSSYNSVALNVGEMRNQGIELMISGTLVSSNNGFNWDASFNMAYNDNEVIKIADGLEQLYLPGATTRTLNGWIYHFEGMPFGMIAGYRPMTNDEGEIVYNSANGLPLQSELMPLGRGVPPLTMGLNNNINFKNFSLGFLLDGKFGAKIYSATNAYGTFYGLDKRTVENNVREDGVTVSGVNENGETYSAIVPAQTYYQGITFSITDQFVTDADFIKLRQLTFGYSFPKSIIGNTPIQSIRLSFVARNLFLLYNQARNIDPESSYTNSNAQGLENFGVPTARSFGFNLNVRF